MHVYILVDNCFNLVEKSHRTGLFLSVENIEYPIFSENLHIEHTFKTRYT